MQSGATVQAKVAFEWALRHDRMRRALDTLSATLAEVPRGYRLGKLCNKGARFGALAALRRGGDAPALHRVRDKQVGSLLAAIFEDESAARAGADVLRELDTAGTLTLYATSIIVRRPHRTTFAVLEPIGRGTGAAAPAVAAAIGALVTLLGSSLAAASRTTTSGLVGAVRDLDDAGFDAAFLDRISRRFHAGCGAVIAEIEQEDELALDGRILAQGGQVFRHRLLGMLTEERMIRELIALRCELRRLSMRLGSDKRANAERRAWRERVSEFQQLLERTHARARALRGEAVAKVAVLRSQAIQLEGAARQTVEQRAMAVRSGLERRAARLDRIAEDAALPPSSLLAGGMPIPRTEH